jgi:hypothetical protein
VTFAGPGNGFRVPLRLTAPKVKVSRTKTVVGPVATLKVNVSGSGTLRVAGHEVKAVRRRLTTAGTFPISVTLSARAKSQLRRAGSLKVTARLTFSPSAGRTQTASVALTFKRAASKQGR